MTAPMNWSPIVAVAACLTALTVALPADSFSQEGPNLISEATMQSVTTELMKRHGEPQRERIERGIRQAARMWSTEDGDEQQFAQFCRDNFIGDEEALGKTFDRLQENLMLVYGHMIELKRDIDRPLDLD